MKNEMVTSGTGYENGWIKYNIDWFVLDIGICCYCYFCMIIQNVLALFFGQTVANLEKVKISQTF